MSIQEVFRMSIHEVKPDLGGRGRQHTRRRRRSFGSTLEAFAVGAAIGLMAVACSSGTGDGQGATTPAGEAPTVNPAEAEAEAVGTVTFDGSTCSLEITADRIEPGPLGYVTFRVVNASDQRVMFDSWRLLDGYTFRAFETAVERTGRLAEAGKPYPNEGPFPDQETEVSYLGSEVIPANRSGSIVTRMSSPGPHAIACLQRFEGAHRSLRGFQPFGLAGPIVVR
jgi:hypothetical protein